MRFTTIGRVENVHFNPWWSHEKELCLNGRKSMVKLFFLASSDWQYVYNTFCYGYNVGYKFAKDNHRRMQW